MGNNARDLRVRMVRKGASSVTQTYEFEDDMNSQIHPVIWADNECEPVSFKRNDFRNSGCTHVARGQRVLDVTL